MKIQKTQRLEANRNIRFQLSSFISIVVIAMLAVTVYLGIAFSARAMDLNVSRYYNRENFQDLQVFSAALLSADDVRAIRELEGVDDVEECVETVAWVPIDSGSINVSVISLLERIAAPEITEGRAPQKEKECIIEDLLAQQAGLQVGDTLRMQTKSGDVPLLLKDTDYTVTGIFKHSDHITDKIDVTPYVMLTDDAFDQELLDGCFTRVRVSLKDMPENRFSKEYMKAVAPMEQALETLGGERMPIRADEVRETYQNRIDDGEKQLSEAKEKLEEGEQQLSDGEKQLQDAKEQIDDGEKKLQEAEEKIQDGEKKLQEAETQLSDGEKQLQDAEAQITDGEKQLQDAEKQIKDGEKQLQDAEEQLLDGEKQLQDAEEQIKDGEKQLQDAEEQLLDGEKQLQDAEEQIKDGERQLKDADEQIADGEQKLLDGERQLEQVKADNADALAQYEQGLKDLADAERRLGLAPGQLADAEVKLASGKAQLDSANDKLQHADHLLTEMELIHDDPDHRSEAEVEGFFRDATDFVKANFKGDEELALNALRKFVDAIIEYKPTTLEEAYQLLDGVLRDGLQNWEQQYQDKLGEWERGRIDYYYSGEQYLDGLVAYEKGKKALNEAADAIQRLQDAEEEIKEKRAELEDAKQLVSEKRAELESGKKEFNEKKAELESGWQTFNEKKAELEDGKREFNEKKAELEDGWQTFNEKKAELESGKQEFNEKKAELESGKQEFSEKKAELEDAKQTFNEKKAELEDGKQEYNEKKAEFESKKQEFNEKKAELENAKQELADSRQALEDGKKEYEDGQREYEENKKKYDEGVAAYTEGRNNLDEIREQFDSQTDTLDSLTWTVLNNGSNGGYVYAKENSGNLSSLSSTFSLMFIVIAALVIYASVARMVDEQSTLVGTTKAMGFYKQEVMFKYLAFGVRSTLIGVIAGILLAYYVLQSLALKMYAPYYRIPRAPRCFLLTPTVLIILGAILLAVLAVVFASRGMMKASAVELMKGKEPKAKNGKGKSTKSSGSLYTRLILLNMRSDLTRVIVTVVSVAGCCVLLMVGFSIKFGEDRVVGRQYGEVLTFDAELSYDSDNPEAERNLITILERKGIDYVRVSQDTRVFSDGDELSSCTLICADPDALPGWYNLRDVRNESTVTESEHGVLITKRMHETYGLNEGDEIIFYNNSMLPAVGQVSGIFNNYFGQLVFTSPEAYREIFGSEPVPNCLYLKLIGSDLEELRHEVSRVGGFLKLSDAASRRAQIETTAKAMNVLIIVMIILAGLMAWFILDNLSGSYMMHKKKELTVMRVNGFSTAECVRYAATELVITTVLGILIGVPVGAWLGYRVIRLTEQSFLQMDRTLDARSVIFSILITAVFALVINGIALSKVKDLKLSDAAN